MANYETRMREAADLVQRHARVIEPAPGDVPASKGVVASGPVTAIPIGVLFPRPGHGFNDVRVEVVPADVEPHPACVDLPVKLTGKYLRALWLDDDAPGAFAVRALMAGRISVKTKMVIVSRLVCALESGGLIGRHAHHYDLNTLNNYVENLDPLPKPVHDDLHTVHPRNENEIAGKLPQHVLVLRVVFLEHPEASSVPVAERRLFPLLAGAVGVLDDRGRNLFRTNTSRRKSKRLENPTHSARITVHADTPLTDEGQVNDNAPVWKARQLKRFGLEGDMATRGALLLRTLREHGGRTKRSALEAAIMDTGCTVRTASRALAILVSAGLVERTVGKYELTDKARVH